MAQAVAPFLEKNLIAKVILITPSLAQNMLETSARTGFINRFLSQERVRKYADIMKKGEWIVSNDAISIDKEGAVINGQHRLHAVLLSGCSVPNLVYYGISRDSFSIMDGGGRRTDADKLFILGIPSANKIAPGLRMLATFLSKGTFLETSHYANNIVKFKPLYYKYADEFSLGLSFYRKQKNGIKWLSVGTCVCLTVIFLSIDRDRAISFFESLITGENLSAGNPILALRRQLEIFINKGQTNRFNVTISATIVAWNLFLRNEKRTVVRWLDKNNFPPITGFDISKFIAGLEYLFQ